MVSEKVTFEHVFYYCICIRKVHGFRVIHVGLLPQAVLAATEAVEGGRVTPSRRRLSKLPRVREVPAPESGGIGW